MLALHLLKSLHVAKKTKTKALIDTLRGKRFFIIFNKKLITSADSNATKIFTPLTFYLALSVTIAHIKHMEWQMKQLNKWLYAGILCMCASLMYAKTYAVVDGKAITDKDMEILKQSIPNFNYSKLSEQEKEALINELVNRQLILKAAKQAGLDTSKEYTDIVNNIKDNLLIDLWTKKQADSIQVASVNDAQMRKIYQENEGLFVNQEGKARHILVKTESEAKAIIRELDKVAKNRVEARFIELANEKSIDPASKQQKNGGDLGVFQRSMMHPDFSKAAFDLKPGTYSKEPVATPFGYHIIYLERKSDPKIIPYSEAKKTIENELKMQSIQSGMMQKIQALRQKAKIEITK